VHVSDILISFVTGRRLPEMEIQQKGSSCRRVGILVPQNHYLPNE